MNRWIWGLVFAICTLGAGPGHAQIIPIDDIQYYSPADGTPQSPYFDQIVTVEGLIYVVRGTYSSGGHYIQGVTGGINIYDPGAPALTYGDRVRVTGVVWPDVRGEIYLANPTFSFLGHEAEPSAKEISIGGLISDYENVGSFVKVSGTVANKAVDYFELTDGSNAVAVYVDADTGVDLSQVADGDLYTVQSPCFIVHGAIRLYPRMQSDLSEITTGGAIVVDAAGGGDVTSIQAGLNLASPGDVVLVADGVYYEHEIDMKSGVTLRSQSGANDGVVIDAEFLGRVIVCEGVDSSARIEGLTLIRGFAPGTWPDNVGAGITCLNSSPTIDGCTLAMGVATYGGGIFCDRSSPTIVGCTISHNDAQFGSALYCNENSYPTMENTLVTYNTSSSAIAVASGSRVDLFCSNIFGNAEGDWVGDIASQLGYLGNICEGPQFCSPTPDLHLNWHLQNDSPCAAERSDCGQIGACGVGCDASTTVQSTWGALKSLYN
jgi:hypothetical protein